MLLGDSATVKGQSSCLSCSPPLYLAIMSKCLFVTWIRLWVDQNVLAVALCSVSQTHLLLNRHPTNYVNPSRSSPFSYHSPPFPSFSLSCPSVISLPGPSPDHVTTPCQIKVDQPPSEQKTNARTRSWNIPAVFKDVWMRHKRVKPLGKAPGVRRSVIAIFKSSREHPPLGTLPPSDLLVLCPS